MIIRQFPSILSRRCPIESCAWSVSAAAPRSHGCAKSLRTSSYHNRCQPKKLALNNITKQNHSSQSTSCHNISYFIQRRLTSSSSSNSTAKNSSKNATTSRNSNSNTSTKYFTTKTNQDSHTCVETELSQLRSEIASLSYLIKQSSSQQMETQALSRRAEARAYIIENKLMDIQSHVVKIPALETMATNLKQTLKNYSPTYVSDVFRRVNESSVSFLTSKYTAWLLLGGIFVFWQYRLTMYQRTSEEVANVAAMTLQQDSLRKTIQETLTTVANSPETLASLSVLFQKLISEERTEQHLINLIVRALNSDGVKDAAIYLLDVCFQNADLQVRAGEFLKVAANATVLDEGVQKNAGVGIQQALKSAVLPWWAKNNLGGESNGSNTTKNSTEKDITRNNGSGDNLETEPSVTNGEQCIIEKEAECDSESRNNQGTVM